jgi:hypothetical protein
MPSFFFNIHSDNLPPVPKYQIRLDSLEFTSRICDFLWGYDTLIC